MILLVEDNPLHRKMYAAALRSRGHELLEIVDERVAMETAVAARPLVAVIDIFLPFIDGRVLIAALRKDPLTRHIAILAISAGAENGLVTQCFEAGADRFQAKPTRVSSFLEIVDDLGR